MGIQLRTLRTDELITGVYELLALHEEHGNGRPGEGILLTVIIRGVLDRLRQEKNAKKGSWGTDSLEKLYLKVEEEWGEVEEVVHDSHPHYDIEKLILETKDLITTGGQLLQKLETICLSEN